MENARAAEAAIVPTDIIEMHCLDCGQCYTRSGNGLRLSKGRILPCISMPKGLKAMLEREQCGSTRYRIFRQCEVRAAPTGTWAPDLSRKRN